MNTSELLPLLKPLILILLLPPVPLIALAALGAGLLRGRPRAGRILLATGLMGMWLSASEGPAQWLALHMLRVPPALAPAVLDRLHDESREHGAVAVLVLGGGAHAFSPEYGGPSLRDLTFSRLRYGVWLARRLDAPLGFSGGIGWTARRLKVSEASLAERSAREEFGLPLRWAEGHSRDTRENASLSLALLKADGVKTVVLVTDDLHMPRARRAFEDAARGEMAIVPAPKGMPRDAMSSLTDWCPSSEGFSRMRYLVYEMVGRLAGR